MTIIEELAQTPGGDKEYVARVQRITDPVEMLAVLVDQIDAGWVGDRYYREITEPTVDRATKILKQLQEKP